MENSKWIYGEEKKKEKRELDKIQNGRQLTKKIKIEIKNEIIN